MEHIMNYIRTKIRGRKLAILLVVLLFLLFSLVNTQKVPKDKGSLRELADKNDILIGTSVVASPFFKEEQYRNVIKKEFNVITIENELKFRNVHPQKETYNFLIPDQIMDFAMKNNQKVRGHTLVWQQSLPDWILNNHFSKDQLKVVLREHIQTVVGRYKGKIYAWDVVNEAFNENGTLRDNIWLREIGPEYLELAFRWAHEADPDAILYYNDYNNAGISIKSNSIYKTLKSLKERGVPIDGVGFQFHTSTDQYKDYDSISRNIKRLSKIGLKVEFTEMDVKAQNGSEYELKRQANIYSDTLNVCLKNKNCDAFIMWGFTDKYSWIPKYNEPLIFNENYEPKPAYYEINKKLKN